VVATGGCHLAFEFEWFVSQAVQALSKCNNASCVASFDCSRDAACSHSPMDSPLSKDNAPSVPSARRLQVPQARAQRVRTQRLRSPSRAESTQDATPVGQTATRSTREGGDRGCGHPPRRGTPR
jgi:hypothetical protein